MLKKLIPCNITLGTDIRILSISWVLRDPTPGQTGLIRPIIRVLGFPSPTHIILEAVSMFVSVYDVPVDPTLSSFFVGVNLVRLFC